jgi:hypothetical protein
MIAFILWKIKKESTPFSQVHPFFSRIKTLVDQHQINQKRFILVENKYGLWPDVKPFGLYSPVQRPYQPFSHYLRRREGLYSFLFNV